MLADVLHHAVRHQIPDRLVVFGAAAYIGRRDGQGRDLKRIDLSFGQGHAVRTGVAGARDGHEVGEVPHEVGVLPLHNFGHGVCAGDEEQLGVGMLGADIAQGVDGVGDARTVDVDTRDGEFGVGCGGDHSHQIPIFGVGDVLVQLEHRSAGGYENHLIEVVYPSYFGGGDQVAVVNRVERAAHDADAQACMPVAACGKSAFAVAAGPGRRGQVGHAPFGFALGDGNDFGGLGGFH